MSHNEYLIIISKACVFLIKKKVMFSQQALVAVTMSPAELKPLSNATDVADKNSTRF